jgi:hypothetical protein
MSDRHDSAVSEKFKEASLQEKRLAILTLAANRSLSVMKELSEGEDRE